MLRTGLIIIAMVATLQGVCFGGVLDSILGPGGLGLWGGGDTASQQYKNTQMGGSAQGPSQQPYQHPAASGQQQITYPPAEAQAYPQSYPGKRDGYPQQGDSYEQQGVYGHPQDYPPAPIGSNPHYFATQAFSAPQQYQASQRSQAPQQYGAPRAQAAPGKGFFNSILGPGGLGLWGGGDTASQQYKNTQMGWSAQGPSQQPYQHPAASGQQQITYPPAGGQAYSQSYPEKGDGYPQQYAAPPAQAASGRAGQAATVQPLHRIRPYVPGQAPVGPSGAEVQYYTPTDGPGTPEGTIQRPARQLKPKRAGAKEQSVKRAQPRENQIHGAQTVLDSLKL